jgi:polysaccharide deacetylase family protein (PEP-CTERM system associated)
MLYPDPPSKENQPTMHPKLTLPALRNELEPAGTEAIPETRGTRASSAAGIANAFTIDVEDYYHVSALAPAIPRDTWGDRESRVSASTDRLLALLDEHRVKGTFFVLGWVADRVPQLIKRIASLGHEVACHGYSHELIYRQSPDVFTAETHRAKALLEDLTGLPVVGYRAASFSITPRSRWALDTLIELGFLYDSSIFPVRHDRYGMPGAARFPGLVQAPSGRQIVEFPMSTAEAGPVRIPVSGGGYFRLLPYWFTRRGLRSINERDGMPFTFYLHPWEVDPEQPRVQVKWLSRFRHYTNLSKCEPRLRRLLGEFRFTTMRKVLRSQGLLSG